MARNHDSGEVVVCWCKPMFSFRQIKVNVDAAIFEELSMAGIGIVIRDQEGRFIIAAKCARLHGISDPYGAELLAAREGLKHAWDVDATNVHLEGDAKRLHDNLHDSG